MLFFTMLLISFMSLAKSDRVTQTFYLIQSQTSLLARDRPCILSLCEKFQRTIVQLVGILKSWAVVLDFEGFRNKSGFILSELAIATENFIDLISFLPPNSNRTFSSSDQKSYQWVSKILHVLLWETGEYPYCYLQQIIDSVFPRFPLAVFYVKGKEKTSTMMEQLPKNLINLEISSCPKVEHLKLYQETPICNLHARSCQKKQRSRHCARKKALLFYHWLMNESTSIEDKSITNSNEFISKFDIARQSIDTNSSQVGKNWLPWTRNSEKTADCVRLRWNRSF